ncbi:TatD DNase family protein [Thermosyntropha lipolytica DSM 11003]|uniref:TatD DNase family protein n=1 Tax=Thermosyntropha lipolytica DSM 11003 TaxID=1123382 RepID=A0A1M5JNL5_9FIRM|nr:TatD family hydrolase [Thermosyntropha lipolytica]SHG41870.1 TatD DNase family protein [Thermosyntropha lipolytica DSM 11003]
MLIDTHAHLQDKALKADLKEVLKRAKEAGVKKIICIGYDYPTSVEAVELARKYEGIYAVVGVHPHDAKELDEETLDKLYQLAREEKVVAVGEIGLDYYRNLSPREKQKEAFIAQIKLAREAGKPVVIHDRDAHQEVLDIIKKEKAGLNGGVMHCYSGYLPMAIELMKEGFYISFAGPVTFNNARKTVEVAANIPLERMLIETDCPYLAPEPVRGKRNEPAYVSYVAGKIAEIKRKSWEEVAYITSLNAEKVFHLR